MRTSPKIAIAYIRVSTDSTKQALGVEAQRAAILSWATTNGVEIVAEYVEEISGGVALTKRTVLLDAIAALKIKGAGILVFQKWDRLARDPLAGALAEIEVGKSGAKLVSADGVGAGDDPAAKLMRNMLLAFGEFEKALIKARIKAALSVKKSRNELTGSAPYGMRAVEGPRGCKVLAPDTNEQAVLARARSLRAEGYTLAEVSAALGPANRAGKPFAPSALHAMLSSSPAVLVP